MEPNWAWHSSRKSRYEFRINCSWVKKLEIFRICPGGLNTIKIFSLPVLESKRWKFFKLAQAGLIIKIFGFACSGSSNWGKLSKLACQSPDNQDFQNEQFCCKNYERGPNLLRHTTDIQDYHICPFWSKNECSKVDSPIWPIWVIWPLLSPME